MRGSCFALIIGISGVVATSSSAADPVCDVGIYGDSPSFVVLTRGQDGLEYSYADGTVGDFESSDTRVVCAEDGLLADGTFMARQDLRVTDTVFDADGVGLAGRLIERPGANADTTLVVYAHGSESSAWLDRVRDPYQMVGRGLSVFVYDKRGTGASGGTYVQNVPRLAADLAIASTEARRLADTRFGRFGLIGLSQGGWVAPYAAETAGAEFVIVGYGLLASILEEDAAEIEFALREAGYGPEVIAQARRITDATALVATTASEEAVRALEPLRTEFASAPWIAHVEGDFTGLLFNATTEQIVTRLGPFLQGLDVDFSIDPVEVVDSVDVPQLWVLAGADQEAPVDLSLNRLQELRQGGLDLTTAVFPQTDHGMWEFEMRADGTRDFIRITPGYYDLVADWAKGDLNETYGTAEIQ